MAIFKIRTSLEQNSGNPLLSTMHFDTSLFTADAAATAVTNYWAALADAMSNALSWTVLSEAEIIDEVTGDLVGVEPITTPGSGSGTLTGQPLPFATQGFTTWTTADIVAGRRLAGRTFVPAPTENLNDAGVPNGDYIELLQVAGAGLLEDADGRFIVYSPTHHAIGAVTGGRVGSIWGVLRSRRT